MKLNIAFSVQSGCLNRLSFAGAASLSGIRNMRSAACRQTVMLSLNRSICAFATAAGSLIIFVMRSRKAPPSVEASPMPICAAGRLFRQEPLHEPLALSRDRLKLVAKSDRVPGWRRVRGH